MLIVLGISIGTRSLGIALMRNRQLIDSRVKTFTGAWSPEKLQGIINSLEEVIIKQGINMIAVKIPHPSRSSVFLKELYESLINWAVDNKIALKTFSIKEIKAYCKNQPNKRGVAEHFSQKYPHLHKEYCKEIEKGTGYYLKMFEAIAIAHLVAN